MKDEISSKKRLPYIDIIKGIVVSLVIFRHAPVFLQFLGNHWFTTPDYFINCILGFFMPAFFVVTGYCSSFNINFKSFIWKNTKAILIPCYCLYFVNRYLNFINDFVFSPDHPLPTIRECISPYIRYFIEMGGFFWFLSALFISKLIVWLIYYILNKTFAQLIVAFCLSALGVILHQCLDKSLDYFFYEEALMLLIFLILGKLLKEYENNIMKWGLLFLISYFVIIAVYTLCELRVPTVAYGSYISLTNFVQYILISSLGTLSVWYVATKIQRNKLLEYMGQGSLVIYCFNTVVLIFVGHLLVALFSPSSAYSSIIVYISIQLISLIFLTGIYWILNHKYLRFVLGKF